MKARQSLAVSVKTQKSRRECGIREIEVISRWKAGKADLRPWPPNPEFPLALPQSQNLQL
jgi:hypothetical protein